MGVRKWESGYLDVRKQKETWDKSIVRLLKLPPSRKSSSQYCASGATVLCCFCLFIDLCFPTFWLLLLLSFLIGETPSSFGAGMFFLMCLQCLAQHSPDLCWWILGTHGIQTINNPHSCCIALLVLYIRWERAALNLLTVRIIHVYFW